MKKMISFVIPCYGSENTIEGVIDEIHEIQKVHQEYNYEIILVNDSSPDKVWEVIVKLCDNNDNIIGIDLTRNFGQHAALLAGYRLSKGDVVVSLDDDGQIAVEDTYKLVEELKNGYDVVYGKYRHKKHSLYRNLGSKFAKWMGVHLMSIPKEFEGSSFYAAKKYIIDTMNEYQNAYVYLPGLVFRATDKVGSVFVGHRKREIGSSGYTFPKLVSLWINGATTFSIKPLRISTLFGFITACVGLIYSIIVLIKKIINPYVVEGWSSMMAVTLVLCGVILIVLGMMGEYVGRLYMSANREPQYVIRQTVDHNKKQDDSEGKFDIERT